VLRKIPSEDSVVAITSPSDEDMKVVAFPFFYLCSDWVWFINHTLWLQQLYKNRALQFPQTESVLPNPHRRRTPTL